MNGILEPQTGNIVRMKLFENHPKLWNMKKDVRISEPGKYVYTFTTVQDPRDAFYN